MVSNIYTTAVRLHSPVPRPESFAATLPAFLVEHTTELYAAISSVNLLSGSTYTGPLSVSDNFHFRGSCRASRREICRNVLSKKN